MKKVVSFILALALLVPLFANTFVYAKNNDICPVNGNFHDYTYSWSYRPAHPHTGHVECECGDIIYADKMLDEDCDICREVLCENGIHYFLANGFSTYGECYCGETIRLNSTEEKYQTHIEHNSKGFWYSSCYFCNIGDEYYDAYFELMATYAILNPSDTHYDSYEDYKNSFYKPEEPEVTHTGNSHDVNPAIIQNMSHPHKGYLECSCGMRSYFDNSMSAECDECLEIACELGIHYYSYDLYYSKSTVYATCYCGETTTIDCTQSEYNEHYDHENTSYISCPLCELEREFSCTFYDYVTESVMSNWQKPIPDDIYYEDEYENEYEDAPIKDTTEHQKEINSFSSYICNINSGEHIFDAGGGYTTEHPHSGYYTCMCDANLYFEATYIKDCPECRVELCKAGIHDFSNELSYTDSTKKNGYGRCYCGKAMNFADAVNKYKGIGLDLTLDDFNIPCAECTFKAILSNELVAFQTSKLQNMDTISQIYANYDIVYAYNHYADVAQHKYNWNCTHSDYYLENKPKPIVPPLVENKPTTVPNNSSSNANTNTNNSTATPSTKEESIEIDPYYMYELPDMIHMLPATIEDAETADAFQDFLDQFFLGNYAEKITPAGTIGEIVFSLTGLDAYKDFTDFWYNLTHWENSWGHLGTTALSLVAIFPIIGGFKSADEVALLNKMSKMDPDTLKILKKIGGVNANALIKLKKMTNADLLKLLKSRGHALSKHVGKTSLEALQILRDQTYTKGIKGAISSFYSQDDAVKFIGEAIKDNDTVATIAHRLTLNTKSDFAVDIDLGKVTGAILRENSDEITEATGIRIVIRPLSSSDFYIKSAFPV